VKGNLLGILFTVLSGVLIAFIVIAYGRSDRNDPEFRFSAVNLTYDSTTKDSDLLVAVNAYDNRDGDLTSRIVVEKVVLNKDAGTAVVYYAVADYSGNVAKQSRVFPADIDDLEDNGDSSDIIEEPFPNLNLAFDNEAVESSSVEASAEVSAEAETN
jgi:hypothetical protein